MDDCASSTSASRLKLISFQAHGKDIMSSTTSVESKLKDLENSAKCVCPSQSPFNLSSPSQRINSIPIHRKSDCLVTECRSQSCIYLKQTSLERVAKRAFTSSTPNPSNIQHIFNSPSLFADFPTASTEPIHLCPNSSCIRPYFKLWSPISVFFRILISSIYKSIWSRKRLRVHPELSHNRRAGGNGWSKASRYRRQHRFSPSTAATRLSGTTPTYHNTKAIPSHPIRHQPKAIQYPNSNIYRHTNQPPWISRSISLVS